MRYLIFSAFFLTSCSRDYVKISDPVFAKEDVYNLLHGSKHSERFKMEIEILNHYLTGILLVKEMDDKSMRFYAMTETGASYFDLIFSDVGKWKVNYIMPSLKNKKVIQTLYECLGYLHIDKFALVRSFLQEGGRYFQFTEGNRNYYVKTDLAMNNIERYELGSERKRKSIANIYKSDVGSIDSMKIKYEHFNMKWRLYHITNTE